MADQLLEAKCCGNCYYAVYMEDNDMVACVEKDGYMYQGEYCKLWRMREMKKLIKNKGKDWLRV